MSGKALERSGANRLPALLRGPRGDLIRLLKRRGRPALALTPYVKVAKRNQIALEKLFAEVLRQGAIEGR